MATAGIKAVERAYPNAVGPASNDLSGLIPDDHAGAIAIELAERLGPSIDWWLVQPFAFGLWCFYRLQELDRRRTWLARMAGIEAACSRTGRCTTRTALAIRAAAHR
jgi:hypothetical protein